MRQNRRIREGIEHNGDIIQIRSIEDSIRATRKYTEGVMTGRKHHPEMVQGGEFPSVVFNKYYEVYPDLEWHNLFDRLTLVMRESPIISVMFHYDYRDNKASMVVKDGPNAIDKLKASIPGFSEALAAVMNVDLVAQTNNG